MKVQVELPHPISRKEREMTKMSPGLSFSREDDKGSQHLVVPYRENDKIAGDLHFPAGFIFFFFFYV